MSCLEISEIEQSGELRWGVSLIDDEGVPVLRNITPLAKGVALATAKTLKHKGPDAPLIEEGPAAPGTPAWVAEKADDGWWLRFTLVSETLFDLLLKPEDGTGDVKTVENALEVVKSNLAKAEIKWNPPEADPGLHGKGVRPDPDKGPSRELVVSLLAQMKEALDQSFKWRLTNVRELENPVLIVLDYSPGDDQRPLSIAFDFSGGAKCWLSEAKVRKIGDDGPKPHQDYRSFVFEGRKFHPYSITAFPQTIFQEIREFTSACRHLYQHADWSE